MTGGWDPLDGFMMWAGHQKDQAVMGGLDFQPPLTILPPSNHLPPEREGAGD